MFYLENIYLPLGEQFNGDHFADEYPEGIAFTLLGFNEISRLNEYDSSNSFCCWQNISGLMPTSYGASSLLFASTETAKRSSEDLSCFVDCNSWCWLRGFKHGSGFRNQHKIINRL